MSASRTRCDPRNSRKRMGCPAQAAVTALAVCLSIGPFSSVMGDELGRWPRKGELRVGIELLKDTVTAYEPVVARVKVTNSAKDAVQFVLGPNNTPYTYQQIRDAKGQVVASTSRQSRQQLDVGMASYRLEAGETQSKFWVLSSLYQFKEPGQFTIVLQLLWRGQALGVPPTVVASEDRAALRVLPFDRKRLEARLEEMFAPLRNGDFGEMEISVRTRILYSVRHDVALPYLDWMAREYSSIYACRAMRRLGTERAKAVLRALEAHPGTIGEQARLSAKLPMAISMWDVVCD
jgi:hypothetical protein